MRAVQTSSARLTQLHDGYSLDSRNLLHERVVNATMNRRKGASRDTRSIHATSQIPGGQSLRHSCLKPDLGLDLRRTSSGMTPQFWNCSNCSPSFGQGGDVKISSEALQTDVPKNEGGRESLPARRAFKMHFFPGQF